MTSVVSRNIFDVLGENEDADAAVKEKEPSAKEPVVPQKRIDRTRAQPKGIRHEYPQRGGHKAPALNRSEDTRSAPRDRNVGPRLSGRREEGGGGNSGGGDYPTRNSRGARPGDRGRGGGRGSRRGRDYDRHSGTGKYDSEKKETQGWGNATESWENNDSTDVPSNNNTWGNTNDSSANAWGSDNTTGEKDNWNAGVPEEKSGDTDGWNAPTEETTTDNNWAVQADGGDGGKTENWDESKPEPKKDDATGDSGQAPEPEEVVKTYEEYLAEKAQKSLDISLPESRKPNEGADDSQWKDAVPLEKDEEEEFLFVGKEQHFRNKSKKSKTKNYLEITQTFERTGSGSSRGRGRGRGRGGRGGDRGGRDDRGERGERSYRDNYDDNNRDNRRRGGGRGVNLDDQRAFPSLGAS